MEGNIFPIADFPFLLKPLFLIFKRLFRVWDEDSERKLSFEKFDKGLKEFQVSLSPEETRHLFEAIDVDHLGYIVYDELLIALRVSQLDIHFLWPNLL